MRGSGLAMPTLALLTTSSAKYVSPSRSRCFSRVSMALVTMITGTCSCALASSSLTCSSTQNSTWMNSATAARARSSPPSATAIDSAHCSSVAWPSVGGMISSGSKAVFISGRP